MINDVFASFSDFSFLTAENAKKTQRTQRISLPLFRMPLGMHRLVEKCVIKSIACRRYATYSIANEIIIEMSKNVNLLFITCYILTIYQNSSLAGVLQGTKQYDVASEDACF